MLAIWGSVLTTGRSAAQAAEPSHLLKLGQTLVVMADRSAIANLNGASLKLGVPIPREISIASDRPWDGRALTIDVIYQQDGLYHILYRGHDFDKKSEDYYRCLAVSRDGIVWEKPTLGVAEFRGSKANNIVGDGTGKPFDPDYVFYDPRPSTPASERVKAIVIHEGDRRPGGEGRGLRAELWASGNGQVFHRVPIDPNLHSDRPNAFDGGSIFWSETEQAFVGYFRWWDVAPAPHARLLKDWMITRPGVRSVFRSVSRDLVTWSEGQSMGYGGTPREHIYDSCTSPYFRSPGLYVALANRFNPGRRALTLEEESALDIAKFPGNKTTPVYTFASDANDVVLMLTKPGSTEFDRPFMEAFLRPGPDIGNWSSRNNYASASNTIIQTGPAEMSFYVTRHHLQKDNHIQRVSLRIDGFMSVNAPYTGGDMTTVPLTFEGDRLELNFSTSGVGEVRAEIQDADGTPLPGFALEDCDVLIGDRIAGVVSWHGRRSVSAYAGKPVRLHFRLSDADLYSFRFQAPDAGH